MCLSFQDFSGVFGVAFGSILAASLFQETLTRKLIDVKNLAERFDNIVLALTDNEDQEDAIAEIKGDLQIIIHRIRRDLNSDLKGFRIGLFFGLLIPLFALILGGLEAGQMQVRCEPAVSVGITAVLSLLWGPAFFWSFYWNVQCKIGPVERQFEERIEKLILNEQLPPNG